MSVHHVGLVYKSINKLLSAGSLKQVIKNLVEEALVLSGAQKGIFFSWKKNKLEKLYDSSPLKLTFADDKLFKKILLSHKLTTIQRDSNGITIVPFFINNNHFGVLVLYSSQKNSFTPQKKALLTLYRETACMILKHSIQYDQAQRMLAKREQFISFAAHEIRNPLTAINGYIQLLYSKKTKDNSAEFRWVKELYGESTRFTTLVKDLLNVKRIKRS